MRALLLAVADWLRTKAWPVILKIWKPVALVAGVLLSIYAGKRLVGSIVDSITGKVRDPSTWTPIHGNPTHVLVNTDDGGQIVKLPVDDHGVQVTSDRVKAVAYQQGYLAKVEVKNDKTDRR